MISLRDIIEDTLRKNPKLSKKKLFKAVMAKVEKEGFFTDEELQFIEEELMERMKYY